MKIQNSLLIIRLLDKKLERLKPLQNFSFGQPGWIHLIRKTLRMSLRQFGNRMSITPQSAKEIEVREKQGTITLNSLRDAANALDMEFVYGFVPKDGSLENMIERKAHEMAMNIIMRTSATMKLEDQENTAERLSQAIIDMVDEFKREMPKKLWD